MEDGSYRNEEFEIMKSFSEVGEDLSMEKEINTIYEVAKATGKAIDAGREVGKFIAKYIDGPLEQGIGIFEDKLKYMRLERQVRLMARANQFLKEHGLDSPTRCIPLNLIVPLMQGGSLEENDDLQDRWAQLLVNAADADSGIEVRRAFVTILEDLTPLDALVLEKIYSYEVRSGPQVNVITEIWTKYLPDRVVLTEPGGELFDQRPSPKVELSLGNLVRLGLISPAITWGGTSLVTIHQTILGREFVRACSRPEDRKRGVAHG